MLGWGGVVHMGLNLPCGWVLFCCFLFLCHKESTSVRLLQSLLQRLNMLTILLSTSMCKMASRVLYSIRNPHTCPNSPRKSSRSSKDGYMPTVPLPPNDLCPFSCAQSKVLLCFRVTVVVFNQLWSVLLFLFDMTSTGFYLLDRKSKNMYVRSSHTIRFTNALSTMGGSLSVTLRVYIFFVCLIL